MFISYKKSRVQVVRHAYDYTAKRTKVEQIVSFKIHQRGIEFTDMPEFVSKNYKDVSVNSIFNVDELEEIRKWLDNEKASARADNLQRDWLMLPLCLKRLIDAFEAGEITLDDDSLERFNVYSEILCGSVYKKIKNEVRKLIAEERKDAYLMSEVLNTITC